MAITPELQASFDRLNPEQRKAVDTMDGPLLVIAGPGTGKTQLLSLRAANILNNRDVSARNILCLTFTEAGAEAMHKRLIELIGREGFDIEVSTFHGFCSRLRNRYPQYFARESSDTIISDLRKNEILNNLLNSLPAQSLLYGGKRNGVNSNLSSLSAFIGRFKKSGLNTDEFRAIQNQTLATFDYLENSTELLELAATTLPRKQEAKEEFIERFENVVNEAYLLADPTLKTAVINTPGIYVPYIQWLKNLVNQTELIDEDGKTEGFGEIRKLIFAGTNRDGRTFAERTTAEKALEIADLFDHYDAQLKEEGLYDYDDMILDAIDAMAKHPELLQKLQDQYQYIQVDEFQDTNGSQLRIVELLCKGIEYPNVMVVGDDDQAIMRFQGASIECVNQFTEKYHPTVVMLKTNYRSTPAIVNLGQDVARQIEKRLPASEAGKDIVAFNKTSDQMEFANHVYLDESSECFALAEDLKQRIDAGFIQECADPEEAIAVIAPKHQSLKRLIPYLRHFNIPFTYTYTVEVFQMESLQTFLSLLRFTAAYATGDRARAQAELPQIVAAPEFGLSSQACIAFATFAHSTHHGDWITALEASDMASLQTLKQSLLSWAAKAESSPLRQLIMEIATPLMAYYRKTRDEDPLAFAEFNSGIRSLLNFVASELETASSQQRALRLPTFVGTMNSLITYAITIDASIRLGRSDAVRLTSAHGSKGLEFDLVYLLDADDRSWRSSASSTSYFTQNLLIGDTKDEDDARRLLFVAITRSKRFLELYSFRDTVVRELQGLVQQTAEEIDAFELGDIITLSWEDSYKLDTPELISLLDPKMKSKPLSASALNDFVEYREGAENSLEFPNKRMLYLPSAPSEALDFGNIVHEFMESYVNQRVKGTLKFDELKHMYRQKVEWMDHPAEVTAAYMRRFDRIANVFVPWLEDHLPDLVRTEATLEIALDDGARLKGTCDLLLIDPVKKEIRIWDYKTGFGYTSQRPSTGYERQLQFYKLLIERSAEFSGYAVVESADLYVEPEKGTSNTLHDPINFTVSHDELEHLEKLISVVWNRIQEGRFDTSGFETSDLKAQALANNVKKDGSPKKNMDHRLMQQAYEDWLIQEG